MLLRRTRTALLLAATVLAVPGATSVPAAAAACAPVGDIATTHARLGGDAGRLGPCTNAEFPVARGGVAEVFQGGSVYWSAATGAHPLYGALRAYYGGRGWENSPLGFPVTDEFFPLLRGGSGQHFQGGSVYWSPATGAHAVSGPVRDAWAAAGWENSPLGYPVGDEVPLATAKGSFQPFQGGSIYRTPSTGAHLVRGAILATWGAGGWERGELGYPVSDEHDVPGGRGSDFQHGSVTWDAASGRTSTTVARPRMAVIGDSLTFGACGGTAQQIPASVPVATAACFGWPGGTSDELQAYVQDPQFRSTWPRMLLPMPGVDLRQAVAGSHYLVVGLGTNDALRDRAPFPAATWPRGDTSPVPSGHVPVDNGYFDQKIDFFLQLAGGRPVYWYDLGYRGRDATTRYYFSHRNDRLNAATRRWPNLHVLRWSGVVAAHPDLLTDEVHPNADGRAARWDLLRSALPPAP
ncbi:GDSL-type esterase/lipase family protein [Kineococcus rubinsiae]|uniref:GDSL-type esterase/lipase family protein n=1 Tax=Kineococcus rubinsiae TaxID=2609562 RepID=UPI00142FD720|nr:GDSL-type esterase/lipase family protein [Kineococcus rubinsiae]NIZ90483.1 hypothetical protein [Kineococcus rubinsiae]